MAPYESSGQDGHLDNLNSKYMYWSFLNQAHTRPGFYILDVYQSVNESVIQWVSYHFCNAIRGDWWDKTVLQLDQRVYSLEEIVPREYIFVAVLVLKLTA